MKIKYISITVLLVFFYQVIIAQCDMPDINTLTTKSLGVSCGNSINYAPYPTSGLTPIKRVRVSFHIIQDINGENNFQDTEEHIEFLNELIVLANSKLANLAVPTGSSPHIIDSRYRLSLYNIHFYRDMDPSQPDFNFPDGFQPTLGASIRTRYIMNNSSIINLEKNNSLHIIITKGGSYGGFAHYWGNKDYVLLKKVYYKYLWGDDATKSDILSGLIVHEVGHALNLYHTFDCHCNDHGCTYYTSLNFMDYGSPGLQNTLTECQLGKVHYNLMGLGGTISDCYIEDFCETLGSPINVNVSEIMDNEVNMKSDIYVKNGATLSIGCAVSLPKSGKIKIENGGVLIIDEGNVFNVCGERLSGIVVENGGTLELTDMAFNYPITVQGGGQLNITNSTIYFGPEAFIDINCDATICVALGATLDMSDVNNVINIHGGSIIDASCLTNLTSAISGIGSVNNISGVNNISNQTYTSDQNEEGSEFNISGNTKINAGDVVLHTEGEVNISGTFEVNSPGTFRVSLNKQDCY